MTKNGWGFDMKGIDKGVRAQDDFFKYANGGWLKNNKIPPAETRWGTFITLRYDTEKKLRKIVDELVGGRHKKGTPDQLVADIYRSAADLKTREKLGTKPLDKWRKMIADIKTKDQYLACMSAFHRMGVETFFGEMVDQDAKDSEKNILHLWQDGLGMPDRDYYLLDAPEQKRVRDEYITHIEKVCKLFGFSAREAKEKSKVVMSIETRLAKASMNKIDIREPEKTYHKKTMKDLEREVPGLLLKRHLAHIGVDTSRPIILGQPEFFKEVERMIKDAPLSDLKTYLEWNLFNGAGSFLSQKFVRENFRFYAQVLMGQKKMKPLWRRALGSVNGSVPDALGQIYVERHFTARAKKMMDGLVDDLFEAYETRIKKLDWMSPATKKKALKKLDMMVRKIGYPSNWKSYKGLVVRPDDYFGNVFRVAEYEHKRAMRKLRKPVDRREWFMSPQTVNAYFNPGMNEIVFPAAILQAPFFDEHADEAVNYGAIGYTIGHEITHGFDDQGSKYDGKGNLKSWWTKSDRAKFEKKSKVLVKQFDGYEAVPGAYVNGKLTLGENIADLGGISIAYDAYMNRLKKTGRKDIVGFTPEQRFFLGCAQGERELARPEFLKTILMTDPHSPAEFRVNGPFSNLEEFYKAFGLKKGDKLYRDPKTRAKIW